MNIRRIFFIVPNLVLIMLFIHLNFSGYCQNESEKPAYLEENEKCIKCHGKTKYYFYNDWTERMQKANMNPYHFIDSTLFYSSNHKNFRCTDCHSEDYTEFPHSWELRMEYKYTCLDCHEGDDNFAEFHFERLHEEFLESVHSSRHSEDFTCWMCHGPHTYKINARTNMDIHDIITYDNEICLSCHANVEKYQLLTDAENPNIIDKHEWLPNQVAHFKSVRCIECHAQIQDDIMVAHNIQSKDKAVQKCVECHSSNSLLMASLYKFNATEKRNKLGFFNASILYESYVIGANRNYYMNLVSVIVFTMVIMGIITHALLRIFKK
jgi:hypothetical protein